MRKMELGPNASLMEVVLVALFRITDAALMTDEGVPESVYNQIFENWKRIDPEIAGVISRQTNATDGMFYFRDGYEGLEADLMEAMTIVLTEKEK